jgi:heat shock protein HslJ
MVVVLLAAGCGASGVGAGGVGPLAGRAFLSTAVSEQGHARPLVAGTRIRLAFDGDGKLSAEAGCNHLFGSATVDGDRLVVSELGGTDMGCDRALHDQDSWLTRFLGSRPSWKLDGDVLVLRSETTELTLTDRRVADPDRPLQDTRWVLESIVDRQAVSSVPAGVEAFLIFQRGDKVVGSTGCNRLSGTAVQANGTITFTKIVTTKIACQQDTARVEEAVLAVLNGTVTSTVEANQLTLTHPSGRGLQLRAAA